MTGLFKYCSIALSLIVVALYISGCRNETASGKKIVTVSLPPQKYLLDRIVGDRMEVRCLLAHGGDPESYEPGMSQMLNLEKSEAYFRIGHIGFEDAIIDKVRQACPDLPVFDNSSGLELIHGTHGHGSEQDVDPHVWSSPSNARIIAANMLHAVVSLDSVNAGYYNANFNRLIATIDSVDYVVSEEVARAKSKAFVVWHPSLSYFARDYGLHQISLGAENKESTVVDLKSRISEAVESGAHVFFVQQGTDSRAARSAGVETGLSQVNINPMNYRWDAEIVATAKALSAHR